MSGPAYFDGILGPADPADFARYALENGISWDVYVYVPSEQDKDSTFVHHVIYMFF